MSKFYITTSIPYVNATPHIGFALEAVQTDVVARYHRLIGDDTYFLTGTDENALKNVQAAEKTGVATKEFVDRNSQLFQNLKGILNLSNDDFIRTTEKRHIDGAQKFWEALNKEDVYKKKYKGQYCVNCESFYTEKDLVDNCCPVHKTPTLTVEEENYFFRLKNYEGFLKDAISKDELKIVPETRKNEILSFIGQGLEDLSISRSVERAKGWGVPVPRDVTQIQYVWVDALTNYITALGYAENDQLFKNYWIDNPNRVHAVGKDINRFHSIYWPALLKSAGLPLPSTIFVHGFVTAEGEKISKSRGNTIDPFVLVEKYGADAVRYYLLREIPSWGDGDFSESRFREVYNADLANGLGNSVARVAKLAETSELVFDKTNLPEKVYREAQEDAIRDFRFDAVLQNIWSTDIDTIDAHVDHNTPWLIKDKSKLQRILQEEINDLREVARKLKPFVPETAEKIEKQFAGPTIKSAEPLFPRLPAQAGLA